MAMNIGSDAFPPTALVASSSDDEESFVVLGSSLPPSMMEFFENKPIDVSVVDEAISLAQSHLSNLNESTSSLPSMPKVSDNSIIPLVERLHLSALTGSKCSSVDLSPDEIQQRVDLLVEENVKLKETLHQNNLAMKHQYETLVAWQDDVMKVHQSHKEKFAETKIFIENLKMENVKLTEALASEKSKNTEISAALAAKSSDEIINRTLTEDKLKEALKKIESLEAQINKQETDNSGVLNDLRKELTTTNETHTEEMEQLQTKLKEATNLQKILLCEIKKLKRENADISRHRSVSPETFQRVKHQLNAAQMYITNLENRGSQDNESENRAAQLELELKEANETLNVARAQLDAYKTDFETEHQLRKNILQEKDALTANLQQLQRRNKQLLDEVERIRGHDFVHIETPATASAPTESASYNCPLCMYRFPSARHVEEHIEYCLNNTL